MDFATKLRCYRSMYQLTQNELADAIGVDRSTYTRYENGRSIPTHEAVHILAKIFSVPASYLLGKDIPPPARPMRHYPEPSLMLSDVDNPLPKSMTPPMEQDTDLEFQSLSADEKKLIARYRTMKVTREQKQEELDANEIDAIIRRFENYL